MGFTRNDTVLGTMPYMSPEQVEGQRVSEPSTISSPPAQRDALAGFAMGMWEPYIQATRTRLPDGADRIVFDRFHIMREMTRAVDTVRKPEHRAFLREDGESPLTKTKYLWPYSE
jgi:hypothetical protein